MVLPDLSAGGAERVTITIARILKNNGCDVEFLNIGKDEGEMLTWICPEFKLTSLNKSRVLLSVPSLVTFMRENPDAIYFSSREHVNLISLISSKIAACKAIVRIPNMPRNVLTKGISGLKLNIIKSINKFLLNYAKKIIAQNEEMKDQLIDFYELNPDKIIAINNPVDKEYILSQAKDIENPFKKDEINFLNVCNIAYSKGIDVLIDAWALVKEHIPNAHMYIVGRNSSDYAIELQKKAKKLTDFTFLGFKSNPYPYLKYCDVFVLPSRMEGFPNVVLEAMCFNKPVASTNCVKVIEEIIKSGRNGYYCNVEDSEALSKCMIDSAKLKNINVEYDLFNKEELINCFK